MSESDPDDLNRRVSARMRSNKIECGIRPVEHSATDGSRVNLGRRPSGVDDFHFANSKDLVSWPGYIENRSTARGTLDLGGLGASASFLI